MSATNIALSVKDIERAAAVKIEPRSGDARDDPDVVDFDGDDDLASPLNWSRWYKWTVVFLASVLGLVVNMAISMCAPAMVAILEDFDSSDKMMATLLVSVWELGEVVGPLLIGPLSEVYGRLPIYHTGTLLFIVFSVIAALSNSIGMLIALRFLMGSSVVSSVVNPVIVGDMFHEEERGRAMGLMGITPYVAPFLGPLLGGVITKALSWRWIFWLDAIMAGIFQVLFMLVYRETYPVIILQRKAERLRKATGHPRLRSRYEMTDPKSKLLASMCRPWRFLASSKIVWGVGICAALAMTMLYIIATTLPLVYAHTYHFSTGSFGLTYFGMGAGMILGITISGWSIDYLLRRRPSWIRGRAECRLPPMLFASVLIPLGMLGFGWAVRSHAHYMGPITLSGFVGMGFCAVIISAWGYLADVFDVHSASANAAAIVIRNVCSATLPLASPPLVEEVGYGWGFLIIALIMMIVAPPIPIWLMRRAESLHEREQTR